MTSSKTPKQSVRHSLTLWSKDPSLPLLETLPQSKNVLIFIPGLTDTLGTVPYLDGLATAIADFDFSLVQPQLSSSLGGYGLSSLEADAQELELVIRFLQEQRKEREGIELGKVVLMGHSTGCQDIAHFFTVGPNGKDRSTQALVQGAILQAPVSDREAFEHDEEDPSKSLLPVATQLVKAGKGATLLPREILPPQPFGSTVSSSSGEEGDRKPSRRRPEVNKEAFQDGAMTAYRYWSLFAKDGHDDYFSSDLAEERTREIWTSMVGRTSTTPKRKILALLGEQDEFLPPSVSPQSLAQKWNSTMESSGAGGTSGSFNALVVQGANHKVEDSTAQTNLVRLVMNLLQSIIVAAPPSSTPTTAEPIQHHLAAGAAAAVPSQAPIPAPAQAQMASTPAQTSAQEASGPAPSFDEIVELISTGQADSIPGIRNIPLKINEASPSQATMERPAKPWERAGNTAN